MSKKNNHVWGSTLLGAAAGLVTAWAALPGRTPSVSPKQTGAMPVAALEPVPAAGTNLWTLQRGADRNNPILLLVHGGPGISDMTFNRRHLSALEKDFVVVNWDQRGAGKSHSAIGDKARINIPQMVDDIATVARHILNKFGKKRLTLMARSWGSAIGMLAIARYPELFNAYVGIGQLSDVGGSEMASYEWTLQQALKQQDAKAIRDLRAMGPPPYSGDWLKKFMVQRKYVCRYGGELWGNPHGSNWMLAESVLTGQEYNFMDRVAFYYCAKQSLRLLQPQLMTVNLFNQVPEVNVPLFFMGGRHDQVVPQWLAHQYFESLTAPHKEWHWFEHAAHLPEIEEEETFLHILLERVKPWSL